MGNKRYVYCHPESVENPFFEKRDFQAVQDLTVWKAACLEFASRSESFAFEPAVQLRSISSLTGLTACHPLSQNQTFSQVLFGRVLRMTYCGLLNLQNDKFGGHTSFCPPYNSDLHKLCTLPRSGRARVGSKYYVWQT